MSAEDPGDDRLQASGDAGQQPSHAARTEAPEGEDALSGEELRAAAAHGIRWSAISRPTVEIVQLASVVVLARLIVPAEFGRFAIAVVAQEVALLLVAGGLSIALVQRRTLNRVQEQTGMAMAVLAGIALTGLTVAAARVIVDPIFGGRTAYLVTLMAPLCLIEGIVIVPVSLLRRRMAFRRLSELEILNTVVRVIAAIALAVAGLGGAALVLGIIAGAIAAGVLALFSAPPPLPRLQLRAAREIASETLPMWLASLSWVGFFNIDYAVIGARLGALQTGYYYRAYTLGVEYQNKVTTVVTQVGFPVLSRTRDEDELATLYRRMIRFTTILIFPLLVMLAVTAPALVPLLFGARWDASVRPVQVLALGGAAVVVFDAVKAVFLARGQAGVLMAVGWSQFVIYGLTVWFVAPLGITAVAIAAAIVHGGFAAAAYALLLRGTGERAFARLWNDIAPATVACLGMAVAAVPVSIALKALDVPSLPVIIGVGAAGLPAYALTLRGVFPEAWRLQCSALARILPASPRLNRVRRRLATAAQ